MAPESEFHERQTECRSLLWKNAIFIIEMKRKQLTKTFVMILNCQIPFCLNGSF